MKKFDIIALACLLLAVLGLGYLFFFAPEAPRNIGYAPVDFPGSTLAVSPGMSSEGMQMFTVNLVQNGFITIHRSIGGAPGPIIAASGLLDKGLHEGTGVALSTPLLPGMDYVALLHVDNGDGVFIMQDDLPVSANGSVVRADFKSDVASSESEAE